LGFLPTILLGALPTVGANAQFPARTNGSYPQTFKVYNFPRIPVPWHSLLDVVNAQPDTVIYCDPLLINPDSVVIPPPGHTINEVILPIVEKAGGRLVRGDGFQIYVKPKLTLPPATPVMHIFTLLVLTAEGPLFQANISLVGPHFPNRTWMTNTMGIAHIECTDPAPTVRISYAGMKTQERRLSDRGTNSVEMQPSYDVADVEVTGYIGQSRRYNTGNIDVIQDPRPMPGGGVLGSMEGKAPGVVFTQTTGVPSGSSRLNIRGVSSLANGPDALYIVDNVPWGPGNQSLSNLPCGSAANSLDAFRPLEGTKIDRIEILKDADATAIYGSKGANGVVLITTAEARKDTTQFSLLAFGGLTAPSRDISLMDTRSYLATRREAFRLDKGTITPANAPDLNLKDTGNNTNWRRWLIHNPAYSSGIQSTVGGHDRNQTASYLLGLNGLWENSVFRTQPVHDNLNLSFNGNMRSKNGRFSLHGSVLAGRDDDNSLQTDVTQQTFLAPLAPRPDQLRDAAGRPVFAWDSIPLGNPWLFLSQTYKSHIHNFLADGIATYGLLPSLVLQTNAGKNIVSSNEYGQTPMSALPTGSPASSYFAYTRYESFIWESQLRYKKWLGAWHLDALGGYSLQTQRSGMNTQSAVGFNSDADLPYPGRAQQLDRDTVPTSTYSYKAVFGRLNIRWLDKYIFTASLRNDVSSRLGNAHGTFYSLGAAWLFSEDSFFRNNFRSLSYGKLRGSWGTTGNDQIGVHYLSSWSPQAAASFSNIPGWLPQGSTASGPGWATIKKLEFAVELGWFRDRLFFTAAWYRNRSSNQLLPDFAAPQIWRNYPGAVIENKGWELTLTAELIRTRQVNWGVSINWTIPTNRLVAFPDLDKTGLADQLIVGQPVDARKVYKSLGVDPATGVYRILDRNHDGVLDDRDMVIGAAPDITAFGGLTTTLRWKTLSVEAVFDARKKTGSNYLNPLYAANYPGTFGSFNSNMPSSMSARWQKPGDQSSIQRVSADSGSAANTILPLFSQSDGTMANTSFVRWRSLYISWQLPWNWKDRSGRRQTISLFLRAQNLLTITPYKGIVETESIIVLPPLRTWQIGLRLN